MNRRLGFAIVVAAVLVAVAGHHYLNRSRSAAGTNMTAAAERFLSTLSTDQRAQARLSYEAPQRTDWHYIPKRVRKGLTVREMGEAQRKAAFDLLRSGLSAIGYGKARKIMQLEQVLLELEKDGTDRLRDGRPMRDPERYYFTLFGEPSDSSRWGLSIEGHHLSLNFVVDHDQVISSAPTFFGSNPGELQADYGPGLEKGARVLGQEEESAFRLLHSLTAEQRPVAVVAEQASADVRGAGLASPPISMAVGLPASSMTSEQLVMLKAIIDEYAHNLPDDIAISQLALIEKAGYGNVRFAWSGGDRPGIGHDYRIQGSTFLIEFNNTQPDSAGNIANHVHSVWHDLTGNFAIPTQANSSR